MVSNIQVAARIARNGLGVLQTVSCQVGRNGARRIDRVHSTVDPIDRVNHAGGGVKRQIGVIIRGRGDKHGCHTGGIDLLDAKRAAGIEIAIREESHSLEGRPGGRERVVHRAKHARRTDGHFAHRVVPLIGDVDVVTRIDRDAPG